MAMKPDRFEIIDMTRLKVAARAGQLSDIKSVKQLMEVLDACECVRRDFRHILDGADDTLTRENSKGMIRAMLEDNLK